MRQFSSFIRSTLCATGVGVALPALALGTHTGWCIGEGNKHSTSACTGGTPQLDTTPIQLPTVNQLPSTQTGPVNGPTPQVLTVPVDQPPAVVEIQRPDLPGVATPQTQLILQEIPRPRPLQPPKPLQPPGLNTPGVLQGGNVVLTPQPQVPVVTVTPQQPLGTAQPQVSTQVLPLAQPPRPVLDPPQVLAVPVPGVVQGGNVALMPQPQVPVVTLTPPQPPVRIPPQVITQLVPLAQPKPPVISEVPTRAPQSALVASVVRPTDTPQVVPQVGGLQPHETPHLAVPGWVVRLPGRQPAHALPTRTNVATGGTPVQCVVSGFGWRKQARADGGWELIGYHPHLRTTDILVRDIPANRHAHAGCVLEVVRRQPQGM